LLARVARLLAPNGTFLVSVPIEIGPTLLAKEAIRTIAAWRNLGDYAYKERYRLVELGMMFGAGPDTAIERPAYPHEFIPGEVHLTHGHKGFNWKALRRRLERDFLVERTRFSPLAWSRGLLSSQAWFLMRPRTMPTPGGNE